MSQIDKVKDRIRKLLNLAENDAATEGEINNAVNFAQRLMQEHHITQEDIHTHAADQERVEMNQEAAFTSGVKVCAWEHALANFVTEMIGSVGVYSAGTHNATTPHGTMLFDNKGQPCKRHKYVFYGEIEEARLATDLYTDLTRTIAAMARMRYGGALRGDGRDYGLGFVSGLRTKLSEAKTQAQTETTALAVRCTQIVTQKRAAAGDWLKSVGVDLHRSTRRISGASNGNAYGQGKADGAKANVTATRRARIDSGSRLALN
jgi:hypothetical protein